MLMIDRIKSARQTLTDPDSWTQGASARDCEGRVVETYGDRPCQFCIGGALLRADFLLNGQSHKNSECLAAIEYLEAMLPRPFSILHVFNDSRDRKHGEILDLLDNAIANLETKP